MRRARTVRNRILAALFAAALCAGPLPAHATSRDIIELQTQVQQLMDMVQRLQSTLDARMSVLQHMVDQTSNAASQMTAAVNALEQKMAVQNESVSGKLDANSGQIQSLSDSVDELKSRVGKVDKALQDIKSQLQNMQTPPPAAAPAIPGAVSPAGQPLAPAPAISQAPPLKETYEAALRDYNAGKYAVASGEFQDVIHYYPLDDMAGAAQFYLGEIAYRQGNYSDAIDAYNAVLEGFSGSSKAPAAQLHKGFALLHLRRREAGITELRQLILNHPRTPEAAQARSKLRSMGLRTSGR